MKTKALVAFGAALALGLGTTGPANAAVKAYSNLLIDNFQFLDGGGTQYDQDDFDTLNVTNDARNVATLDTAGSEVNDPTPTDGAIDPTLACVGPSCDNPDGDSNIENDFDQQTFPGEHFGRADTKLVGSSVDDPSTTPAESATAEHVAESHLRKTDSGRGVAEIGTTSGLSFTPTAAGKARFDLDATRDLEVIVQDSDTISGSARASMAWSIKVRGDEDGDGDKETVLDWEPDGSLGAATGTANAEPFSLNDAISVNTVPDDDRIGPQTGSFSVETNSALDAGVTYDATIEHVGSVRTTQEVPEPTSLVLLGVGLLGLGAMCRRHYLKT